jgi:triacylglycerol lipase
MAPGTMGQGDQCAPSRLFNQVVYCGGQKNIMAEYQAGNVAAKVDAGIAVFVTDYENMGTNFATHKAPTFANRLAQGHAVIDGAKAALNLAGTSLTTSSKIIFWGYDQGGAAAGAAAELLASYAPTSGSWNPSRVVGAYCGSPPANLFDLLTNLDASVMVGVVAFLLNGFKVSYPGNASAISTALSPLGTSWLVKSQNMCVLESAMTFGFKPIAPLFDDLTTQDEVIRLMNQNPWRTMLADQQLGTVVPGCPIFIDINPNDPFTSLVAATRLAQQWTTLGGDVQLFTSSVAVPTLGLSRTGLIHYISAQTDDAESLQWCNDRFNGVATTPNPEAIGTEHTGTTTLALTVESASSANAASI